MYSNGKSILAHDVLVIEKESSMGLEIALIAILVVWSFISFIIGLKNRSKQQIRNVSKSWYENGYLSMGLTTAMLALFFLVEVIHDPFSERNLSLKVPLFIVIALLLTGAVISAGFMLRAFFITPLRANIPGQRHDR